ncbi:hypothetical protein [Gorillibacterium sp. sgz5001074]|uniref:hypothetical protein n=1 Tax=Gorillibacterium sp. sgz5001074 TaxID=3446695 RepID=UPI003F663062
MKTYHTSTGLRLVGKAYEVRWQLQRLLETARHPHAPLSERLADWAPADRRLSRPSAIILPFPAGGRSRESAIR